MSVGGKTVTPLGGASTNGQVARPGEKVDDSSAFPNIFNGVVFEEVNVPSRVQAGRSIDINGVVGFDCPQCVVDRAVRVVASASHLGQEYTDEVGSLSGRGETAVFNISMPAPVDPTTISVRLQGQRNPPIGDWETDNTAGPFTIHVVTQGEAVQADLVQWAPWVVGGGAIGIGAAHLSENSKAGGALLGGGLGASAKVLTDNFAFGSPDFPTVAVVSSAALLGAGAWLLGNVGSLAGR